jgi:hypothetical protein
VGKKTAKQKTFIELDDPEVIRLVDDYEEKRDAMQAATREFAGDKEEPGAKGRLMAKMKAIKKREFRLTDGRVVKMSVNDPTENVKVKRPKADD